MKSIKKQKRYLVLILVVLGFCLSAVLPLSAQSRLRNRVAQATQTARDPLASLSQALKNAEAAALSSAQEQQLNDLVSTFKNERKAQSPDSDLQSARKNYEAAILTGNEANATAAAEQLARALSARSSERLEARAAFLARAYAVLQSDQVSALERNIGRNGLLRVLRSLIKPTAAVRLRAQASTS